MSELPCGWALGTLEELTGIDGLMTDGDWIETKDQDPGGDVRLVQLQDVGDGKFLDRSARFLTSSTAKRLKCTFLEAGDVLIARMPDPIGRACRFPGSPGPSITAVDVCIWRAGDGAADPDWIVYAINSPEVRRAIEEMAGGTTRQRVSGGRLKRLVLSVPPVREQRRITAVVAKLRQYTERGRRELGAVLPLVERYRRSILGKMFANSGLRRVPLGTIATKIGSGATPRGGKKVYQECGVPLVRSQNVHFAGFASKGLVYIGGEHADELKSVEVRSKDVLLNITGASIGRVCIAPPELEGARVSQHVCIIRVSKERLLPEYLSAFLRSPSIQDWIWSENYGVTRQALTKGMIEAIEVPTPSLEEQGRIVGELRRRLEVIGEIEEEVLKAQVLLRAQGQAILRKAGAGLLVPQDPSDEPMSVVLDRVRSASKSAAHGLRRRREPSLKANRARQSKKPASA